MMRIWKHNPCVFPGSQNKANENNIDHIKLHTCTRLCAELPISEFSLVICYNYHSFDKVQNDLFYCMSFRIIPWNIQRTNLYWASIIPSLLCWVIKIGKWIKIWFSFSKCLQIDLEDRQMNEAPVTIPDGASLSEAVFVECHNRIQAHYQLALT